MKEYLLDIIRNPEVFAAFMALIMVVSQALAKAIPETATGVWGIVRKLLKVIGLYNSNKIAPGISTSDIVKNQLQLPSKLDQVDDAFLDVIRNKIIK